MARRSARHAAGARSVGVGVGDGRATRRAARATRGAGEWTDQGSDALTDRSFPGRSSHWTGQPAEEVLVRSVRWAFLGPSTRWVHEPPGGMARPSVARKVTAGEREAIRGW
jgi:hypothetical protein